MSSCACTAFFNVFCCCFFWFLGFFVFVALACRLCGFFVFELFVISCVRLVSCSGFRALQLNA